MLSSSRSFLSRARALLLLPAVVVFVSLGFEISAQAAALKAPTNVGVLATLYPEADPAAPAWGQKTVFRVYKITWTDNSLDESGFRIEASFSPTGPFSYLDSFSADSTEGVWQQPFGVSENSVLYFRVTAFKYNGTKVETSSSAAKDFLSQAGTTTLNAPTVFRVTEINDGFLRFNWVDNSSAELYHQIFYKKQSEANSEYKFLANIFFNQTQVDIQHGLVAGESYVFAIRASRIGGTSVDTTNFDYDSVLVSPSSGNYPPGNATFYKVPRLDAPTNLVGRRVDNERIKLTWEDNSDNETSYTVEYRKPGSDGSWSSLSVNKNTTTYTLAVGPGGTYEWRVKAASSGSTLTSEESDYSNVFTVEMPFIKPDGLVATTSGISGAVELTWQDTSIGETNYDVYAREVDEETEEDTWYLVETMQADSTRITVRNRTTYDNVYDYQLYGESYERVALTPDKEYEFKVLARYAGTGNESDVSNTASAFARYGFTSRSYQPAQQDVAFSYTLTVSDSTNKTDWTVEDLPDGLTFDVGAGTITGTPAVAGVFTCPMTVTYLNYSSTLPLTLRILKRPALPEEADPIPAVTVGTDTQITVPLDGKFSDEDSEMAVRLKISGNREVDILLYPSLTPEAVENFMGYVDNQAYDGVIFHRAVVEESLSILQGGAYVPIQSPYYFASLLKRPSSLNEPGISNVRGTVAHAKVGGSPDSATHDFFFNMADNSSTGAALDNQNGGFTVFGRVAGTGMTTVDAIADLPIGSYKDSSSSGGSDTRVYIDGVATSLTEIPMDVTDATAPATMDYTKTVRITSAREVPVFKYEVVAGSEAEEGIAKVTVLNGTELLVEGLAAGTREVTVKAYDLDLNPTQQTFTVNVIKGHKPPVISKQPVSVTVLPGKKATLSVTASGSSLEYQWQKKEGAVWMNVPDAEDKSLVFTAVNGPAEIGEYRVQISNVMTSVISASARVDLREVPAFTQHPEKTIVEVGEELELEVEASGAPQPTFTWLRNGKTVSGQKAATLNIAAAQLTDGGSYIARASNAAGKLDSNAASVVVVDKGIRLMLAKRNATVKLVAQVTGPVGPGVSYEWKKGDTVLEDGNRISGATTATLTIKKFNFDLTANDTGRYTCKLIKQDEGIAEESGPWNLYEAGVAPAYSTFVPDDAQVGVPYSYLLPGADPEVNHSISSFAIKGLPPGLSVNATSGLITGTPRSSGTFYLAVTVKNPAGSRTVSSIPFKVLPMPEAVVGIFVGQVGNAALNGNKGGRIDMVVTDGGLISGKLTQAGEVLSFTGEMDQPTSSSAIYTSGGATVNRKGRTPLQIEFSAISVSGYTDSGDVYGTISDGIGSLEFTAYRNPYNLKGSINGVQGRHHVGLYLADEDENTPSIPQGNGYLIITTDAAGSAKVVGRTADGATITSSSFIGGQNQILVYQALYKNTGSLVGQPSLTRYGVIGNAVRYRATGQLMWTRDAQTASSERLYKAGFGPLAISVDGMTYVQDDHTPIPMSLPDGAGNANIDFSEAGLSEASLNPDLTSFRILKTGSSSIPSASNPAKTSVKMVKTTGLITGGFTLTDPAGKRAVKFYGLVIPRIPDVSASDGSYQLDGAAPVGVGYFLLPQLPAGDPPTTLKNSPILSGGFRLNPTPIVIQQQPQSVTVNPGENVTFAVVATAPSNTLYYQWRKDGKNISGATASTYSISSVQATNEADYDVIITTAYSRVQSEAATLELNAPVSNVVVSRTPTDTPLPVGGSVTFTATAQGSGTFTYRWRKNGSDIAGEAAAAATYTINPLTLDDSATYTVRVSSSVTPGGVISGGVSITVANPITSVVAQRTPSAESIGVGASVTFSISSIIGSAGPYTYQWRKDGENIEGATSATYFISGVSSDSVGNYTVLVKNGPTPDGVLSQPVSLNVSTEVSNVNASRSPADEYVALNNSVTFSVSVQGQPDFEFQWRKNGVDIEGATSADYVIPQVTGDHVGDYTVLVKNATSELLSNVVRLDVQLPVTTVSISLDPDSSTIANGDTITLSANPDAVGPYTYHWFKNESEILDQEGQPSITLSGVNSADSGNYRVEVGNEANDNILISSNTVTLTVVDP